MIHHDAHWVIHRFICANVGITGTPPHHPDRSDFANTDERAIDVTAMADYGSLAP